MGLEGIRGNRLAGLRGLGIVPPARATTIAGLYGTADVIKSHPFLIVFGLLAGGWWAAKRFEGGPAGQSTAWGEQRYAQSRERSFHGTRRRRR